MQAEWWREAMRTPKARTTERYPALPRIRLVRRRFRAARPISCVIRQGNGTRVWPRGRDHLFGSVGMICA